MRIFTPTRSLEGEPRKGDVIDIDPSAFWEIEEGEKIALLVSLDGKEGSCILGHYENRGIGCWPNGDPRSRSTFVVD